MVMSANPGRVATWNPSICRATAICRSARPPSSSRIAARLRALLGERPLTAILDNADVPASPRVQRSGRRSRLSRRAEPRADTAHAAAAGCSASLSLLGIWAALVYILKVPTFVAPSPLLVAATLFAKFGILMANLLPTAIEAHRRLSARQHRPPSCIATVFVHKKTLEEAFFPVVVLINTIPVVAKAPILVLLLGNGMEPKIAIAALVCFFPTLVNMVRGLESVNPQAMELMRVLSASKTEVFFKLRLLQFAAVSVFGAEDRGLDRGGRRHRRRVDRLQHRHRRADHPGDVRFRLAPCSTPP